MKDGHADQLHIGAPTIALWCIGLFWVGAALLWAAPAPYSIDGFIYWAMIDAFARDASLFVENGYDTYRAEALRLLLLVPSGDQLAAQYPGGWGVLGAPAYMLGGVRGVVVLNALAAVLTMAIVWYTARALFQGRAVAHAAALLYALASIAADYAFGIWPHSVATCAAAIALFAAARAWASNQVAWALAAGLAIGIGINLRVDVLFVLPALAVWLLGAMERPYRAIAMFAAGLVPGIAAASAINFAKFGTWMPISYGSSDGLISVGQYTGLIAAGAIGMVLCLALGLRFVRAVVFRPVFIATVLVAGAAAAALIPQVRTTALLAANGLWVLLVDFQAFAGIDFEAHGMNRNGVQIDQSGTVHIFGLIKKSLLQSMPFLALVVLALPRLFTGPHRASVALCFLVFAAVVAPFAKSAWHGGMANSMRYFLHAVPALVILAGWALVELQRLSGRTSHAVLISALGAGAAGAVLFLATGRLHGRLIEVDLPMAVAALLALLMLAALVLRGPGRSVAARIACSVAGLAIGLSFVNTYLVDLQRSHLERRANYLGAVASADLPENAVLVTYAAGTLAMRLNRPPAVTVQPDFRKRDLAADAAEVIARAMAEGRPVIADGQQMADAILARGVADGATELIQTPRGALFLMTPPG